MSTSAIHDGCEAGALAGLMSGRSDTTVTATSYSSLVGQAKAIADAFITVNNGSITDQDKASMAMIVQAAAQGACDGRYSPTGTATDPIPVELATIIYAVAAEAKAAGGLT